MAKLKVKSKRQGDNEPAEIKLDDQNYMLKIPASKFLLMTKISGVLSIRSKASLLSKFLFSLTENPGTRSVEGWLNGMTDQELINKIMIVNPEIGDVFMKIVGKVADVVIPAKPAQSIPVKSEDQSSSKSSIVDDIIDLEKLI